MDIATAAIVLAGGNGTKMMSKKSKVLHKVADLPMVCHTIKMIQGRGWAPIVVVVNPANAEEVKQVLAQSFPGAAIAYEVQREASGCLQATEIGLKGLGSFEGNVMVLPANMPLLQADTTLLCLEAMIAEGSAGSTVWLEQAIAAVQGQVGGNSNSSAAGWLRDLQQALPSRSSDPDGDALSHFASAGFGVNAASEDDLCVVSTRADLAEAESLFRARLVLQHQAQGVTFRDVKGTFLGANVVIGRDTEVGVGVQIYGNTQIGESARIEGPTTITDSQIGEGVFIRSFSVLEGAKISKGSGAGPFARLREGTDIAPNSYIGNFVETKNAKIGSNTLACHLTYLGDTQVGSRTNIGAGIITCNFNGAAKNTTTIGDNVFVGSNSTLVAPVQLGSGAVIAAGSVITDEVPAGSLTFGRARQTVKEGGAEPLKAKLKAQSTAK